MQTLMVMICSTCLLQAQAGSSGQSGRAIGVVQKIDAGARRITVKTDDGQETNVSYDDTTRFLRVAPGAKDLTNATSISSSDLEAGDRILARGRNVDENRIVAATIIVMSKSDIARKHEDERAEWTRRGIGGVITALDSASREITINRPAVAASKPVLIELAPGAVLRRYAPGSVKFSDARPSRFEELQIGDQVKALGNLNEDRTRFTAEQLIAGSFRNILGTVVSSDPGQNTILITDLATGNRVQAQVVSDTMVHRLSDEVAKMIAVRIQGGASPSGSAGGESPRQQSNGNLQTAIERLPRLSLSELKPGEAVILTCTSSSDPSRVTAITLLAGVEPILRLSSKGGRPPDLGAWNLDLNMNAGGP